MGEGVNKWGSLLAAVYGRAFLWAHTLKQESRLGSTFPFATLESRRELEPKCVPQLFLGRLLEMCRSAIGQFFSLFLKWESQKSLLNVAQPQPGVFLVSKLAKFNEIIAFCHRRSRLVIGSCPGASSSKVPVNFRARKAVLRLPCFHSRSKFQ